MILCTAGTGKQFQIPVRLWLPKSFPKDGPSIQVNPTPDMALAEVNYVDADGMMTMPYLKHWKEVGMDGIDMLAAHL
jgi:ESCRT-I complex subunit TSG101